MLELLRHFGSLRCLQQPPSWLPSYLWQEWDLFGLSRAEYTRALRIWDWVQSEQEQGRMTTVDFCDVVSSIHAEQMRDALLQPCEYPVERRKLRVSALWKSMLRFFDQRKGAK